MKTTFPILILILALAGCVTAPQVTRDPVTGIATTNQITTLAPVAQAALDTAGAIVPVLPPPANAIAGGALALTSIVLAAVLRVKNRQAALAPALIGGIEAAAGNETVKAAVYTAAKAAGVQQDLHTEVTKRT